MEGLEVVSLPTVPLVPLPAGARLMPLVGDLVMVHWGNDTLPATVVRAGVTEVSERGGGSSRFWFWGDGG
jgi:hypothetical protein